MHRGHEGAIRSAGRTGEMALGEPIDSLEEQS